MLRSLHPSLCRFLGNLTRFHLVRTETNKRTALKTHRKPGESYLVGHITPTWTINGTAPIEIILRGFTKMESGWHVQHKFADLQSLFTWLVFFFLFFLPFFLNPYIEDLTYYSEKIIYSFHCLFI